MDPSYYCSLNKGESSFWNQYSNRVANATKLDDLNVVKVKGSLDQDDIILLAGHLVEVASVEVIHVK